jgi:hypothetical protein
MMLRTIAPYIPTPTRAEIRQQGSEGGGFTAQFGKYEALMSYLALSLTSVSRMIY